MCLYDLLGGFVSITRVEDLDVLYSETFERFLLTRK